MDFLAVSFHGDNLHHKKRKLVDFKNVTLIEKKCNPIIVII